jgi:hypothetical protein
VVAAALPVVAAATALVEAWAAAVAAVTAALDVVVAAVDTALDALPTVDAAGDTPPQAERAIPASVTWSPVVTKLRREMRRSVERERNTAVIVIVSTNIGARTGGYRCGATRRLLLSGIIAKNCADSASNARPNVGRHDHFTGHIRFRCA